MRGRFLFFVQIHVAVVQQQPTAMRPQANQQLVATVIRVSVP
jgi:hypothetical protein